MRPPRVPDEAHPKVRSIALLLALGLSVVSGCANCGGDGARPAAADPEGLVLEAAMVQPTAFLARLKRQVRDRRIRSVVPSGARALIGLLDVYPPSVVQALPGGAAPRIVYLDLPSGIERVVSVPLAQAPRDTFGGLPMVSGAPHGASWLGGAPGEGAPALIVDGACVVHGSTRLAAEMAMPYLRAPRAFDGAGLHLRMPESVPRDTLKPALEAQLRASLAAQRRLLGAAAAEAAGRDAIVDPRAVLEGAASRIEALLGALTQLGAGAGRVEVTDAGLVFRWAQALAEGAPLRDATAEAAPFGLLALPRDAAIAWASPGAAAEPADPEAPAEMVAFRAAFGPLPTGRHVVALGGGSAGAWALLAGAMDSEGEAPSLEPLAGALRNDALAPTFRALLGGGPAGQAQTVQPGYATLRFPLEPAQPPAADSSPEAAARADDPDPVRRDEGAPGEGAGAVPAARAVPTPLIELRQDGRHVAYGLSQRAEAGGHPATATFLRGLVRPAATHLGGEATVASAVDALGPAARWVGLVSPSRLPAALGLVDSTALRALATAAPPAGAPAPLLFGVGAEGGTLHVRLVLPPGGIDDMTYLLSVFGPLLGIEATSLAP